MKDFLAKFLLLDLFAGMFFAFFLFCLAFVPDGNYEKFSEEAMQNESRVVVEKLSWGSYGRADELLATPGEAITPERIATIALAGKSFTLPISLSELQKDWEDIRFVEVDKKDKYFSVILRVDDMGVCKLSGVIQGEIGDYEQYICNRVASQGAFDRLDESVPRPQVIMGGVDVSPTESPKSKYGDSHVDPYEVYGDVHSRKNESGDHNDYYIEKDGIYYRFEMLSDHAVVEVKPIE